MTTETTIESIELALAERFESLRRECYGVWYAYNDDLTLGPFVGYEARPKTTQAHGPECCVVSADTPSGSTIRGWVPNVTTDALLEALTSYKGELQIEIRRSCPSYSDAIVFIHRNWCDGEPDGWQVRASNSTVQEALLRAAWKALDA